MRAAVCWQGVLIKVMARIPWACTECLHLFSRKANANRHLETIHQGIGNVVKLDELIRDHSIPITAFQQRAQNSYFSGYDYGDQKNASSSAITRTKKGNRKSRAKSDSSGYNIGNTFYDFLDAVTNEIKARFENFYCGPFNRRTPTGVPATLDFYKSWDQILKLCEKVIKIAQRREYVRSEFQRLMGWDPFAINFQASMDQISFSQKTQNFVSNNGHENLGNLDNQNNLDTLQWMRSKYPNYFNCSLQEQQVIPSFYPQQYDNNNHCELSDLFLNHLASVSPIPENNSSRSCTSPLEPSVSPSPIQIANKKTVDRDSGSAVNISNDGSAQSKYFAFEIRQNEEGKSDLVAKTAASDNVKNKEHSCQQHNGYRLSCFLPAQKSCSTSTPNYSLDESSLLSSVSALQMSTKGAQSLHGEATTQIRPSKERKQRKEVIVVKGLDDVAFGYSGSHIMDSKINQRDPDKNDSRTEETTACKDSTTNNDQKDLAMQDGNTDTNLLDDGFLEVVSEKADKITMKIWGRKLSGTYSFTPLKDNGVENSPGERTWCLSSTGQA